MIEFFQGPIVSNLILLLYLLIIISVSIQVIYDSTSPGKTMGYLLLIIFVPLFGVILYLSIGVNYRNRRMYSKKLSSNKDIEAQVKKYISYLKNEALKAKNDSIVEFEKLAYYLSSDPIHWLSLHNHVKLLNNGEEKFPAVLEALENATSTIHIEYYIVRNDVIGNKIKEVLIRKAQEGVKVRFIYDAFGGRALNGKYAKELRAAGAEIYPFRKLIFITLANRLNYRNHRKIIVVDGKIGFVGGINIGDEYINRADSEQEYLRDTHICLEGYSCYSLQYIFLSDWNFCAKQRLEPCPELFPLHDLTKKREGGETVQIVASGPDSPEPMIMNSILLAIATAKKEILITTPYFVPSESVLMMMKIAAKSKVKIKLLVPARVNSWMVSVASRSLFKKLMEAGVEIYQYEKGFIHAKTTIFDRSLAFVGTANMDNRSFDLNFEVNAVIYDNNFALKMANIFFNDLEDAKKIDYEEWKKRSKLIVFFDKIIYLASSLL